MKEANIIFQRGFTLVEIALVLLIVTIVVGYTIAMFPVQQELRQYREVEQEMDEIMESLYAFAQVNGYLPCPAWADDIVTPTNTSDGFECRNNDATASNCDGDSTDSTLSCDIWFGYIPAKSLGIAGKYSDTGFLLDPWGQPYLYQVTDVDIGSQAGEDFVTTDVSGTTGIKGEAGSPMDLSVFFDVLDLQVCNVDPSAGSEGTTDIDGACSTAEILAENLPVVILSTGKDTSQYTDDYSWIQRENLDNRGGVFNRDTVFVKVPFNNASGTEFDDIVKWMPPNVLYSRMIDAGQLP